MLHLPYPFIFPATFHCLLVQVFSTPLSSLSGLHNKPGRGIFSVLASQEDTKTESPCRAPPPPYLRLIDYQDIALRNGNSSCRNLGINCLNDKHIKLPHDISRVIEQANLVLTTERKVSIQVLTRAEFWSFRIFLSSL